MTEAEKDKAGKVLSDNGYYIENLWHIEDVFKHFKCSVAEAKEVLNRVLLSESLMEVINEAISIEATNMKLEEREEPKW